MEGGIKVKKYPFIVAVAALVILGFSGLCWAQEGGDSTPKADKKKREPVVDLGTINVTAKRYQSAELETPSFTTVLDQKAIQRQGANNAFDLLKSQGGFSFSAQFPGGISQGGMNGEIGIRGIKGGELVMLNGMPIIDPSAGSYDLDMIPSVFLQRVESVKGAASALYGSRAMTGVVNIFTRGPGAPAAGGGFSYGSHSRVDTNAWWRNPYAFIGINYTGFGDLTQVKRNYSARRPYNTDIKSPQRYAGLVSISPWKPVTLSYMYNHLKNDYTRDYPRSPLSSYEANQKLTHHYLTAAYQKDLTRVQAFFTRYDLNLEYDYANPAKPLRHNDKKTYTAGLDAQSGWNWGSNLLLYGMSYLYEKQDETKEDVKGSSRRGYYIQPSEMNHQRHQASVFAVLEHTFQNDFTASLGLRGQAVFNQDSETDNYFEPVPQLQLLYRCTPHNSVYLNLGRAFRVPTFNQLYADTDLFAGNPKLNPEYGWTYELGWKGIYEQFNVSLAAFLMDYRDKIRYVYDPAVDRYLATNMDKFRTVGIEWSAALKLHEYLTLRFSGYLADPQEEINGVEEQAGPRLQFAPGLYFQNDRLSVSLRAEILADRERNLDDYLNLHLNASYQVTDYLKLKFKVDNLLDKELVVYGNMESTRSPYEVLDPGMWVYAGLEVDLNLL